MIWCPLLLLKFRGHNAGMGITFAVAATCIGYCHQKELPVKPALQTGILAFMLLSAGVVDWAPAILSSPSANPTQICVNSQFNPILNDSGPYFATSTWFRYSNTYTEPSVLRQGSLFHLWFTGFKNNVSGLYHATSTDGVNWIVGASRAIPSGANGSWDFSGPYGPSVVWNGTRFLMYYWGDNGSVRTRSIGVATSADGAHWVEYAHNPILTPGPSYFDGGYIKDPNVVFDNGRYLMWYKGRSLFVNSSFIVGIDFASSQDGVHWTKYSGNPVLGYTNASSFQQDIIFQKPSVVEINGTFVMAAVDGSAMTKIGYATSRDGVHWQVAPDWLVRPVNNSGWNGFSAMMPSLLLNGSRLFVFYTGVSPFTGNAGVYKSGIGLAVCALIVVRTSVTTTATTTLVSNRETTSTLTTTSLLTTTQLQTVQVIGPEQPVLLLAAAGAGIAAIILAALLVRKRQS